MNDFLKQWIRPEMLAESNYHVPAPATDIKLNQNESAWDWPAELKNQISHRIANLAWNRYPQQAAAILRERLAQALKVPPGKIVLGNGSNEILAAITILTLAGGDTLCALEPSFAIYPLLATWRGAKMDNSTLADDFQVSVDDLLARSSKAKLTILCNPNSPTGTLLPLEVIAQVAEAASGLVVVDEAYVHYATVTALDLIEQYPNLVVTQTFSKAYSMAGFRLGYGVMSAALVEQVSKGLLPFNLDAPTAAAATVLLDHQEWVDQRIDQTIAERDKLIEELNSLDGIRALPSQANFFLLQTDLGPRATYNGLLDAGILIRDVSGYPGCQNYVRITVGRPEENHRLAAALEQML